MSRFLTIRNLSVIALAVLLVLCALMPAAFCGTAYAAEFSADAVTATTYGDYDTDSLWYFAEDELNISELRAFVSTNVIPVLEANSYDDPVVIAVVDTGLDLTNSVFSGLLLTDEDGRIMGYNSYYDSKNDSSKLGDIDDETEDKHGTKVASVIAMLIRELGLEDYIRIYPVKASYPSGSSDGGVNNFDRTTVRLAISNAAETGADVINLSLCSTTDSASTWANDAQLQNVIASAATQATIVAAAGNEGRASTSTKFYPAAYDGVIGVMASAEGGTYYQGNKGTNYGPAYDVFAPGANILVSGADASYELTSGTSMAAPIVSFAAALLKLTLTAEELAGGEAVPRNTVVTRLITHYFEDDASVTVSGDEYKKLDILKLVSKDILNMDDAWLPVTGISVSATRGGSAVTSGGSMTVQTIRETGSGRSYLDFTASLTPVGDTDPALEDTIVWELVEYTEDSSGEESEANVTQIGSGASCGYLFSRAGDFGVRASITTSSDTYTAEFRVTVAQAAWNGANAFIVTSDYISSDAYVNGTGGSIENGVTLYGTGNSVTLTVTTIEDVAYEAINWYVNGEIAWTGATFTFEPSGVPGKDYTVTAQVILSDTDKPFVRGAFTVHHKSWAAHPLFAILWTALGVGVCAGAAVLIVRAKKKKAAAAAAEAEKDILLPAEEEKKSPIRKK